MPLRKTGEDSHGLFVRFNTSLYRPQKLENKSKVREKQLVYIFKLDDTNIIGVGIDNEIEIWKRHGPFKYNNGKYINTDLIWVE